MMEPMPGWELVGENCGTDGNCIFHDILVCINYILCVPVCSDTTLAHRGRDAHQGLAYGDLLWWRGEAEEELQAICGFQEVFAQFGECVDQYLVRSCFVCLCVCNADNTVCMIELQQIIASCLQVLVNEEAIVREELRSKPADFKLSGEKAFERHKSKTALFYYQQIFFHLSIFFLIASSFVGDLSRASFRQREIGGRCQGQRKERERERQERSQEVNRR